MSPRAQGKEQFSPSVTFIVSFFGGAPVHERKGIPLPTGEFRGALLVTFFSFTETGDSPTSPRPHPTLSFLSLCFWNSLLFSPCEEFLVFSSVFPFFSRDLRGSVEIKNPCFFGGLPCPFQKKQGKEGQGTPRNGPETDPKRSQTDPNGQRTETEPKWTEIKLFFEGAQTVKCKP